MNSTLDAPQSTINLPSLQAARNPLEMISRCPQLFWCAAFIPIVAGAFVSYHRTASGHNTGNLLDFLDASRAMLSHKDIYAAGKGGYVYPPLIAFLYQPLAIMPDRAAAILMLCIEAAAAAITLVVASNVLTERLLGSPDTLLAGRAAFAAALLTADKIKGEFAHLETNVFMLLAYTLAFRWIDRRPRLCGLALGFAFNIKYLPIALVPWLLLRRRWEAVLWFAVFAIGIALLPSFSMGFHANAVAWLQAGGGVARLLGVKVASTSVAHVRLVVDSVSISATSGLARVTGLPPSVAELLAGIIAVFFALFAARIYARSGVPFLRWPRLEHQQPLRWQSFFTIEWLALLLLILALSPFTNSRHLYMLLDVNIAAVVLLLGTTSRSVKTVLIVAVLLLFAGITFPPGGTRLFDRADEIWRTVGGPGWCMLGMGAVLLWSNARHLQAGTQTQ